MVSKLGPRAPPAIPSHLRLYVQMQRLGINGTRSMAMAVANVGILKYCRPGIHAFQTRESLLLLIIMCEVERSAVDGKPMA